MPPAETRSGNIYDLGYRGYEGARRGRPYAVLSLYLYTLRGAFGIGRRTSSKIIPIAITVIAFLPALVQLGVAAIVSENVEVIRPENYFGFVQVPVALFAAAVAVIRRGLADSPVRVRTRGGDLVIAWEGPGAPLFMRGPAASVFEGEWTA